MPLNKLRKMLARLHSIGQADAAILYNAKGPNQ